MKFLETTSLESESASQTGETSESSAPGLPGATTSNILNCAAGSSTISSVNGTNTCQFSWGEGAQGSILMVMSSTGGGSVSGICNNSVWQITSSCPNGGAPVVTPIAQPGGNGGGPNPSTCTSHNYSSWGECQPDGTQRRTLVVSIPVGCSGGLAPQLSRSCEYVAPIYCPDGSANVSSPDGSNQCAFSWSQTLAGTQNINLQGTNGGTIAAHCGSNGVWTYSAQCPNLQAASCPAGSYTISSPNGSNSCQFAWGFGNVGSSISPHTATGGGSVTGVCRATGWETSFTCPDSQASVTCSGGSTNVPSSSGKPEGCYFVWPETSSGSGYSGSGSNGGSVSATCDAHGSWQILNVTCP